MLQSLYWILGFSSKCFVMIFVFSGWSCPPVQDKKKNAGLKCKLSLNSISIQSRVKKVLLLSSWWSHEGLCVSLDLPWMFLSLPVKCLQLFSCEVCRTANIGWLLRYIKKRSCSEYMWIEIAWTFYSQAVAMFVEKQRVAEWRASSWAGKTPQLWQCFSWELEGSLLEYLSCVLFWSAWLLLSLVVEHWT